jgi:protocatechuate 3,4-dioxygenase beta subunit
MPSHRPTPHHPAHPGLPAHAEHDDHHDGGLVADLDRLMRQTAQRRQALRWLVAGGAASASTLSSLALVGCGGGGGDAGSTSTTTTDTGSGSGSGTTTGTTPSSCSLIPVETAGPYPGDGSNTSNGSVANALALSGIVRSDIRSSVGGASGTAAGIPLTLTLQLVNTNGSCANLDGYAIYLWHCDAVGRYSMYSSGVTNQNYLRGVQATSSAGLATFVTIFPGCYTGRMPHMHFEVYRSTTTATSFSNKLKTSQIAFPTATCQTVYTDSNYTGSQANLSAISFSSDNVFSDGVSTQMATVSGSNSAGYTATLVVGISA